MNSPDSHNLTAFAPLPSLRTRCHVQTLEHWSTTNSRVTVSQVITDLEIFERFADFRFQSWTLTRQHRERPHLHIQVAPGESATFVRNMSTQRRLDPNLVLLRFDQTNYRYSQVLKRQSAGPSTGCEPRDTGRSGDDHYSNLRAELRKTGEAALRLAQEQQELRGVTKRNETEIEIIWRRAR